MRKLLSIGATSVATAAIVVALSSGVASASAPAAGAPAGSSALTAARCEDGSSYYEYRFTGGDGSFYYRGNAGDWFISSVWRGSGFNNLCI